MARYIDADAFEKQLNRYVEYNDDGEQEINADDVFITLHEQPTADVVERKRGEWIPQTVSSGRDSWKCSICGRRARGKKENLPFCHCGADMRGEEK